LVFLLLNTFYLFGFPIESIWWKLFQKRVVYFKLDIYVFIRNKKTQDNKIHHHHDLICLLQCISKLKVIFKISCIIFYNIDLHNCEQIFTHLHLNLSGKAFKVGDQHFSSVSDTLNGIIFRQYLWNILMFILSYPTTESPFRLKNVPSDVTFLLQIDQIFEHFTKTQYTHDGY
jgi:hypothetical protein